MAQAMVSFSIDEELKRNYEILCGKLGLTVSTALTGYIEQMLENDSTSLMNNADPFFGEGNLEQLNKSIEQIKSGRCVVKTIDDLEQILDE